MNLRIGSSSPISVPRALTPRPQKAPVAEKVLVNPEPAQPGARTAHLSALAGNFAASPAAGLANRTAGITADVMTHSNQGLSKWAPSPLAQRAGPFLPLLNTVAVPINAAHGCKNTREGLEKLATGRRLEGGAQLGQGTAQLGAAGAGGMNLAAHCAGNAGLKAATGKLLLRGLGPAVAGFEGVKNLAEASQAEGQERLEKGYSGTAKLGGAGMMAWGGPVTATIGGGIILGTSIGEALNQTETVQNMQEWIADRLSGPQSVPPITAEEFAKLKAAHKARRGG